MERHTNLAVSERVGAGGAERAHVAVWIIMATRGCASTSILDGELVHVPFASACTARRIESVEVDHDVGVPIGSGLKMKATCEMVSVRKGKKCVYF